MLALTESRFSHFGFSYNLLLRCLDFYILGQGHEIDVAVHLLTPGHGTALGVAEINAPGGRGLIVALVTHTEWFCLLFVLLDSLKIY